MQGYEDGEFKPDRSVSRAEYLVMLMRHLKLEGNEQQLQFTDQENIAERARQAIAQAVAAKIVSGYEDGSFRPDRTVTRLEMAVIVARAIDSSAASTSASSTPFADDGDIPGWAKGSVQFVFNNGLMQGRDGGLFVPHAPVTRAEAATVLIRLLDRS